MIPGLLAGTGENNQVGVFLEGVERETLNTAAGEIVRPSYEVEVIDGQLTLALEDLGGNTANAAIAALTVQALDTDATTVTETQCSYDANDRLLVESLNNDTDPEIDQATTYAYGPNADLTDPANPFGGDHTTQTAKTVWQGNNTDPDAGGGKLAETTYEYNLQGRLATVKIDSDADGNADTQFEYEYNENGIRVAETKKVDANDDGDFTDAGESTERTEYVVDEHNPTGYAQILEEWLNGELAKSYTLGLDVISQWAAAVAGGDPLFFLYDGHGSTRGLVDPTGEPLSGQVF